MSNFYFLNESIRHPSEGVDSLVSSGDLPVRITKKNWDHHENPNKLSKEFSFDNPEQQIFFVTEVMRLSAVRDHEIKITITGASVGIETYTKTLDDVTQIDLEIARECDFIFNDSRFYVETM